MKGEEVISDTFGEVFKTSLDGKAVIVKSIKKAKISQCEMIKLFLFELAQMVSISDPRLPKFYSIWDDEAKELGIVVESIKGKTTNMLMENIGKKTMKKML